MEDDVQFPPNQPPTEMSNSNMLTSLLMPHLQNLFQRSSLQQDLIVSLLNSLLPAEAVDTSQNGKLPPLPHCPENNGSVRILLFSQVVQFHVFLLVRCISCVIPMLSYFLFYFSFFYFFIFLDFRTLLLLHFSSYRFLASCG